MKLFAQYLWKDEPRSLNDEFGGWQSGLRFADGDAEAVAEALRDAVRDRRHARAPVGTGAHARDADSVKVQRRTAGSSTWRTIATRKTDAKGYWSWTTRLTRASYRFLAAGATSATLKRR